MCVCVVRVDVGGEQVWERGRGRVRFKDEQRVVELQAQGLERLIPGKEEEEAAAATERHAWFAAIENRPDLLFERLRRKLREREKDGKPWSVVLRVLRVCCVHVRCSAWRKAMRRVYLKTVWQGGGESLRETRRRTRARAESVCVRERRAECVCVCWAGG